MKKLLLLFTFILLTLNSYSQVFEKGFTFKSSVNTRIFLTKTEKTTYEPFIIKIADNISHIGEETVRHGEWLLVSDKKGYKIYEASAEFDFGLFKLLRVFIINEKPLAVEVILEIDDSKITYKN